MGRLQGLRPDVLTPHVFAAGLFALNFLAKLLTLRLLTFRLLALALLGLEPVSEAGTPGQGWAFVLPLGLPLHHRFEGALDFVLVVWRRFFRGRLRLFLRHHAFLAPLDFRTGEILRRKTLRPATLRRIAWWEPHHFRRKPNRKSPQSFFPVTPTSLTNF